MGHNDGSSRKSHEPPLMCKPAASQRDLGARGRVPLRLTRAVEPADVRKAARSPPVVWIAERTVKVKWVDGARELGVLSEYTPLEESANFAI